jgi:hypothetical protein
LGIIAVYQFLRIIPTAVIVVLSSNGGAGDGVDVIVSVSDDFTAKVFHLNIAALAE